MEKLIISEERTGPDNSLALLTLSGTIETTNASGLEDTLERIIDDRCFRIVVDLGMVKYISSAGWGIFISEIKRIRRNGGDIKLAAMTPEVREVFELLEFNLVEMVAGRGLSFLGWLPRDVWRMEWRKQDMGIGLGYTTRFKWRKTRTSRPQLHAALNTSHWVRRSCFRAPIW